MARFSPNVGPPRSRTVVNPRRSVSVAAVGSASVSEEISHVNTGVEKTDFAASQVRQSAETVVARADYLRSTVQDFLHKVAAA